MRRAVLEQKKEGSAVARLLLFYAGIVKLYKTDGPQKQEKYKLSNSPSKHLYFQNQLVPTAQ